MTLEQLNAVFTYDPDGYATGECVGCGTLTTARVTIKISPDQDGPKNHLCRSCKGGLYRRRGWDDE